MKKCKLLLALSVLTCLLTLMCLSANAATYSGTCGDNLTWSLDTDTGVLEISGTGAMEDYSSSSAPWYSCRDYVKTVTIGDGITCIGDNAFYNCRSLTSVTIGDSVTSIGSHAFFFCSSLTSVTIPFGVTSIGVSAFCYCSSLTSATISDSVTSIATSVFLHCTSLETISVDENNAAYSSDEYGVLFNKDKTQLIQYPTGNTGNAYIIPSSVTSIDCNAFYNCRSLTSVTIGDSVTSIGTYAFGECSSLETISVDGNNTTYSSDEYGVLFNKDKTKLIQYPRGNTRNVYTIPSSVTSIGNEAFYNCGSLETITIPNSVTSIGWYAFFGCTGLQNTVGNLIYIQTVDTPLNMILARR